MAILVNVLCMTTGRYKLFPEFYTHANVLLNGLNMSGNYTLFLSYCIGGADIRTYGSPVEDT